MTSKAPAVSASPARTAGFPRDLRSLATRDSLSFERRSASFVIPRGRSPLGRRSSSFASSPAASRRFPARPPVSPGSLLRSLRRRGSPRPRPLSVPPGVGSLITHRLSEHCPRQPRYATDTVVGPASVWRVTASTSRERTVCRHSATAARWRSRWRSREYAASDTRSSSSVSSTVG